MMLREEAMRKCAKCGEPTAEAFFKSSGTICESCWHALDMGRFLEIPPPAPGDKPDAKVVRLANGKLAITCPHCHWRVLRLDAYFFHDQTTSRCPHCMEHYIVKKGEAE